MSTSPRNNLNHLRKMAPGIATSGLLLITLSPSASAEPQDAVCRPEAQIAEFIVAPTLKVVTLNTAHGRKSALNQMLVTRKRHRANLDDIAGLLQQTEAIVIGLQEADGPSLWSGRFDHVRYLGQAANFACVLHGHHADNWLYDFGSALLANVRMHDTRSHSFKPSWPTTTKGLVSGTVRWFPDGNAGVERTVTLASVHLDFSRRKVREAQIQEIVEQFGDIDTPVILMGDFNAEWADDYSPLREIAERYDLQAYMPTSDELNTYKGKKRLDWILISKELEFVSYAVLTDVVSDHLGIIAEIAWRADNQLNNDR